MVYPRFGSWLILAAILAASTAGADEVYLSTAGSTGVFRTDARIFNPSFTVDIVVNASFLPAGNVSNAGVTPKAITIPKRTMVSYNDVVASLFEANGLGAIRLVSDADFIATQRIYAVATDGTLGQFVPGLELTAAKKNNVIIQLKANGEPGAKGTYRTNIGLVNPNAAAANVTMVLYDKANAVVGQVGSLKVEPFGVVAPTSLASYFTNPALDLSDAWLSVRADVVLFAYGSVVDNGTTDPTFIPAYEDTGVAQTAPPPAEKHVNVGPDFSFDPESLSITEGDTVTWTFRSTHTTTADTSSSEKWDSGVKSVGQEFSHTFETAGVFPYHCALHSTSGGSGMNGTIVVAPLNDPNPYPYKRAPSHAH